MMQNPMNDQMNGCNPYLVTERNTSHYQSSVISSYGLERAVPTVVSGSFGPEDVLCGRGKVACSHGKFFV